ncbi:Catalase HPII [compost metagenome]
MHYLLEAYKHLKPIALSGESTRLIAELGLVEDDGLLGGDSFKPLFASFVAALKQHRIWAREARAMSVPA